MSGVRSFNGGDLGVSSSERRGHFCPFYIVLVLLCSGFMSTPNMTQCHEEVILV